MDVVVVSAHLVALMVPGAVAASHYYFVASTYFPAVYSCEVPAFWAFDLLYPTTHVRWEGIAIPLYRL
jgi:hypothetical protein